MNAFTFKLPDVGEGIVEAEIVAWHIHQGDTVQEDDPLFDLMTDKATVEITSPVTGKVDKINAEIGTVVAIGTEVIEFSLDGEAPVSSHKKPEKPQPASEIKPEPVKKTKPEPAPAQTMAPVSPVTSATSGAVLASPFVRREAFAAGIDLANVPGSGPGGRILEQDLKSFQQTGPVAKTTKVQIEDKQIAVTGLRRVIAEKMALSKRAIPHYSYIEEVDVTELERLRQHMKKTANPDQANLTILPFIVMALVRALEQFPGCNAHFDEESRVIHQFGYVHVGMAAQTADGLKVPVIRHAENLGPWDLAAEIARLAKAAKDNTARLEELTGSTITITSLGPIGGIATTPVINHPEVSIIGVNKIQDLPRVYEGRIEVRKIMNLSSSFDHRIVDGFDGARMVQQIKSCLENPATIFI